MPNPMLFDSEDDYRDACLSANDRIVQALTDRGDADLVHDYVDWVLAMKPETAESLLIDTAEAHDALQAFAKSRSDGQQENDTQAKIHQMGLDE